MKKILVLICTLFIISIICLLLMLKQKNDNELLNKDIDLYKNEISKLEENINDYETLKEQVKEELLSKLDENKRKEQEVWENQNNYLKELLK